MRGHVTPAATAATLRQPEDRELGVDTDDGRRLSRCLRCDSWIESLPPPPATAQYPTIPPLAAIDKPRRGKPLEEAIIVRLIAIDRAAHSLIFGLLGALFVLVDTNVADLKSWADTQVDKLTNVANGTVSDPSRDWLSRQLDKLAHLNQHAILVFAITALGYCVLEGVEAVGLWRERRWAEYLTVVATAGFLPFEIHELINRVTILRVGTLIVNVAILVYLVYAKRMFGVRGGERALHESVDWDEVLRGPTRQASGGGGGNVVDAREGPTPAATTSSPAR